MQPSDTATHSRKNKFSTTWKCEFCAKVLSSERSFETHRETCEVKKKIDTLRTPLGQMAYESYRLWFKLKGRKQPSHEAFIGSRYFTPIIKFSEQARKVKLSDLEMFINLMVRKDWAPSLWRSESAYRLYLDALNKEDLKTSALRTIQFLDNLAAQKDIQIEEILPALGIREIISLIRAKKISPVILLRSSKFEKMYCELDENDTHALHQVINATYWQDRMSEDPEAIVEITGWLKELGI
jgi:hypothetical protein